MSATSARRYWMERESKGKAAPRAGHAAAAPAGPAAVGKPAAAGGLAGLKVVQRKVDPASVPEFKAAPKKEPPAAAPAPPAPAAGQQTLQGQPAQPQQQAQGQQQGQAKLSAEEVADVGTNVADALCAIWEQRMGGEALTNADGEPLPPGPITKEERAMLGRAIAPAVEKYLPKYAEYHVEVNLALALVAVFGGRYQQARAYQEHRRGKAKRAAARPAQREQPGPVAVDDDPGEPDFNEHLPMEDPEDAGELDPEDMAAADALTRRMKGA